MFPVERKASSKGQRWVSKGGPSEPILSSVWLDLAAQEPQGKRGRGKRGHEGLAPKAQRKEVTA